MGPQNAPTNGGSSSPPPTSYTDDEIRDALDRFYAGDDGCNGDGASKEEARRRCGHCFGYDDPHHKMSMLQRITATAILDYDKIVADSSSPVESELLDRARKFRETNGPVLNLRDVIKSCRPAMALAAEFKRASPSKGDIAPDLDAGEQASTYALAGASVVSVLTEGRWFKGSLDDLTRARLCTATAVAEDSADKKRRRPAILRKDFITSRYMIAEAAASGADTVLLIVATTPSNVLKDLIDYARSACSMEPLVEVHAAAELDVALEAGAKVIGVNNRNLHTFELDLDTTDRTAAELAKRGLSFRHDGESSELSICALSGMSSSQDVDRYRRSGVGMCLIGESLMRAADPTVAIKGLCLHPGDYAEASSRSTGGGAYIGGTKIIKICGVTNAEDAEASCRMGANLIGVIFAEKSKRKVSYEMAGSVVDAVRKFGERTKTGRVDVAALLPPSMDGLSPIESLAAKSRALEEAARRPLVVGVFQNQSFEYIRETVETCGLDLVQLHGSEGMSAATEKKCGVPALRVVDIELGRGSDDGVKRSSSDIAKIISQNITSDPLAILLDTSIKGAKHGGGGTGVTFDWTIAEAVQGAGLPVIIAGGLTPDNIAGAVQSVRSYGIDVSGGVEGSPGKKDHEKLRAYLTGAREAAVEANKGF